MGRTGIHACGESVSRRNSLESVALFSLKQEAPASIGGSTFTEGKEEKMTVWTADEKHIITTMTKDEVTASFDQLFLTADFPEPALEERVAVLENAIAEMTSEVVSNG